MSTVDEHDAERLAPVCLWMAGGFEHAVSLGAGDVAPYLSAGGAAVDLGAGVGMHAVRLARAGYRVLAVDSSPPVADLESPGRSGVWSALGVTFR